jgi:hypothetical protein
MLLEVKKYSEHCAFHLDDGGDCCRTGLCLQRMENVLQSPPEATKVAYAKNNERLLLGMKPEKVVRPGHCGLPYQQSACVPALDLQ